MATSAIHGAGTTSVALYSDGTAVVTSAGLVNDGLGTTTLGTQTVNIVGGVYTGSGHWLGGNGNWGDITMWDSAGGTPGLAGPLSSADIATFSSGGGVVSLSGRSPQIAALNFTSATAAFTITSGNGSEWLQMLNLSSSGTTLNAAINVVGTQTIAAQLELSSTVVATVSGATDQFIVAGAVSGVGGLIKSGAGLLLIGNNNSNYGGGTTLLSGIISAAANNALGSGALVLTNGGTLTSSGNYTLGNTLVLSSGGQNYFDGSNGLAITSGMQLFSGTNVLNAVSSAGSLNLGGGNVTFLFPGTATLVALAGASTGSNVLSVNLIDNAGSATSVLKSGAGSWALDGSGNYTGGTTINGGTLIVGGNSVQATVRSISTRAPSAWAG